MDPKKYTKKEYKAETTEGKYKIQLLEEESVRKLYQQRLESKLKGRSGEINNDWEKLKTAVKKTAFEVLGTQRRRKINRLKIWNEELKEEMTKKKASYRKWINTKRIEDHIEYKKCRAIVRKLTRKHKRESWDQFVSRLERDITGAKRYGFKIFKQLKQEENDRARINTIQSKQWEQYYKRELYDAQSETTEETQILNEYNQITMEELEIVLKEAKNRKAPGKDNINMELWKYGGKRLKLRMLQLMNDIWNSGKLPEEWSEATVINIHKKGNKNECKNYRGIALLNTAYKIYASIIKKKLQPIAETIIGEEQNGFREGRSCTDASFTIKQIVEKRKEYNLETCLAFIDYEKAYDRVDRKKLWNIMEEYKIPKNLTNSIKALYYKSKISLAQDSTNKMSIEVNRGLRQGCGLSPILFDLYLNKIIQIWRGKGPKGIIIHQRRIDTICFADDQVILAENEEELQRATNNLNQVAKNYNMTISKTKTKSMALKGKTQKRIKIVIDQKIIEQVAEFTYLGTKISTMSAQTDIEGNLQKYNQLNGCIKRHFGKGMSKEVKLRLHDITSKQALRFASETWVLRAKDKSRIEAAHMRFLRSTLGVTRRYRLRNTDIRNQLQQENMVEEIQKYQNQWREHVLRMNPTRLPRQALFYRPSGGRDVGRPVRRWSDQFN